MMPQDDDSSDLSDGIPLAELIKQNQIEQLHQQKQSSIAATSERKVSTDEQLFKKPKKIGTKLSEKREYAHSDESKVHQSTEKDDTATAKIKQRIRRSLDNLPTSDAEVAQQIESKDLLELCELEEKWRNEKQRLLSKLKQLLTEAEDIRQQLNDAETEHSIFTKLIAENACKQSKINRYVLLPFSKH